MQERTWYACVRTFYYFDYFYFFITFILRACGEHAVHQNHINYGQA